MFFENIHTCPYCGEKKGFFVAQPQKGEMITYSTNFQMARSWRIVGDDIIVTIKCDKCCRTSESRYTIIGENNEQTNS